MIPGGGSRASAACRARAATLGVIETASVAVNTIGQGLALARGLVTKHAIKQVDRLLSNRGVDIDAALLHWVRYVVGFRTSLNVAMDWTEFDADGQATIMLSLLTRHGRATPLMWLTVDKSTLLLSEAALLHIDGNVLDRPVRHIDGCLGAAVELERQQADKDTRPEHCLVVIALIDPGNEALDTANPLGCQLDGFLRPCRCLVRYASTLTDHLTGFNHLQPSRNEHLAPW